MIVVPSVGVSTPTSRQCRSTNLTLNLRCSSAKERLDELINKPYYGSQWNVTTNQHKQEAKSVVAKTSRQTVFSGSM